MKATAIVLLVGVSFWCGVASQMHQATTGARFVSVPSKVEQAGLRLDCTWAQRQKLKKG